MSNSFEHVCGESIRADDQALAVTGTRSASGETCARWKLMSQAEHTLNCCPDRLAIAASQESWDPHAGSMKDFSHM
jgi:hypothetical protein